VRRFLTWYLPLGVALLAGVVFADGLVAFLRGDTGARVDLDGRAAAAAASAQRGTIAPIIVGDSLARGTGDDTGLGIGGRLVTELRGRHVKTNNVVNIGINGARTGDLLRQLESPNIKRLLGESNVVVVSIGGNDLWGDNFRAGPPRDPERTMGDVLARVEEVVHAVRSASPNARVFVIGLYNPFTSMPFGRMLTPFVNRWNAKEIERFANDPLVTIVQTSDIFAFEDRLSMDHFHPSGDGYARIARRIADAI
jgi:lysophospholipase L1-like esterase